MTGADDVEARAREERFVGSARERREDPALVRGDARYTADLSAPGMVHLAFVRSPFGHATVESIDASAAEALPGVLAVYTRADVAASDAPGRLDVATEHLDVEVPGHPILATDRVRYQGQPVAAVVAESRARAADAVRAVDATYDRRDAVVDPVAATDPDAPAVFESCPDNVATAGTLGDADATERAFADADRVVELDLRNNRLIPTAIEPRAALAREEDGRLRVDMTSQNPHEHRADLAATLGLAESEIHVVSPDVGGGFGHKGHHYPGETVTAWAARRLGRPVKWVATRSENYQAGAHGRDHVTTAALAFDDDGTMRGLRADTHANVGGYGLGIAPILPTWYGRLLAGQYDLPAIHCRTRTVFTNTAPVHTYRGAGRPEAIYVLERLVKRAADDLGMDPAAFRRRNLLDPDDFPVETVVGATYDSGDYEPAMDRALDALDYDHVGERSEPTDGASGGAASRAGERSEPTDGRLVGVGLANFVESTGLSFESGVVRVHPDGGVTVYAGTHSHGQGHGTTYAQIVADELGLSPEAIDVVEGDTDRIPRGTGTFGSRSTIAGGSALAESAREVREAAREIAGARLEADPDDVELADGAFHVAGAPERSVSFREVAQTAYSPVRPPGVDPGLEATTFFEQDGTAYAFGTHGAVVSVDPDTGELDVERYVAVDDCGVQVNPRLVEGQIHGGVAQGVGQALSEQAVYDDNGTLLTGSLQDYAIPKAEHVPEMTTDSTETPSPTNPLGVKGVGEAGTIAAPPALVNAVVDALAPLGVDHVDMPLTEETVWRAIEDAR
ncbi:MAG: xanthine dehydrogenase family protein molybdopterin-binding subunit [Haloarculaceae archaeon]